MLQPKKPWEQEYQSEETTTKKPWEMDMQSDDLKKKESAESISTTQNGSGASAQSNGSLDFLQTPKSGQDLIVEASQQIADKQPKETLKTEKLKKDRGFLSEVYHKLAKGSSQLGADIASIPELLYDTFSVPQNAVADMFDIPSLKTDSEKIKKTVGVKNAVKDYYKGEVSKLKQQSEAIDKKYQAGIYDSFKNGDYADGFRQLTNSFAESLPATTSIMLGGAYAKAPQLLATSTMVFGANKNEQLKDENPNMNENKRIANALGTGLAEGAFETIGSGSIGSATRALIEREGKKKATTILKDGLANFYKEALKKNPLMASMAGEGIEEWATQVTQNSIDVATGVKPKDYNVFNGATDAFIGGAFGGAVFGGGLHGVEQIVNQQDRNTVKSNFKKTFELQKQLDNPNISPEMEAQLHENINKLVKENKQIISANVKHADELHPKIQEELHNSVFKMDEIKAKVNDIKLDKNTSDASKQILLDNLKQEYKSAQERKNNILDGKTTVVDVLPLKEQDALKREALKELTAEQNPDGTKNITIDDKQITERANKIYKVQQENEVIKDAEAKIPTPETKSETEVQKPTIVVHGAVNGFGLQYAEGIDSKDIVAPKDGRGFLPQEQQKLLNEYKSVVEKDVVLEDGSKSISIITPSADNFGRSATNTFEFVIPKGNKSTTKGIQSILDNVTKSDLKGKEVIDESVKQVKEYINSNETTSPSNIESDGDFSARNEPMGESGITKQQNTAKEGVSKPIDGGEGKGDASVGENPDNNGFRGKDGSNRESESESKKLGVSDKDYTELRDLVKAIPTSGEVKNYDSGDTISRIFGEPINDQSYEAVTLEGLKEHADNVTAKAKELFGNKYIEKMVEFLDNANLNADEKAIQYVSLENEIDSKLQENPNDLGLKKLQSLINEKSQAHLRKSAIAINAGRLRAIMKYGIDISKYPDEVLTTNQLEAKRQLEKSIQHTSEDINKEAEAQETEDGFTIAEPKNKRSKVDVKKDIDSVIAKMRADLLKVAKGGSLNASIPYAKQVEVATPHIIKLSKLLAELGGMKTKEIIDAIHEEISKVFPAVKKNDISTVLKDVYGEKEKRTPKDKTISDIVKQALIDAGFSRNVKIKGEEKTLLDWKKLAGEESSIPKLKENVETSLKKQGYTDSQISKISKSLEDEYIRLGADIIEKSIRELENRNKLRPTPERKTEAKRLSELYNYGLFNGENNSEYENLLNKTLGLSDIEAKTYQSIKKNAKALASIYNQENNGHKITKLSVQTLESQINHKIKSLLADSNLASAPKHFRMAQALADYIGLSMRGKLGSVSTLFENRVSGELQVALNKVMGTGKITPELESLIKKQRKNIKDDIVKNAGLFYGDTNTSLTHASRFEEWMNGKTDNQMAHLAISTIMLRSFLDGVDSSVKVSLTQRAFINNAIKILTNEAKGENRMSKEDALKYVSEQLTGENFDKALETSKSIIDNVNNEAGEKVLKDNEQAVNRFALDLVKENLLADKRLTMDEIEASFKAGYKSAGRSIGHEANNIVSTMVNYSNSQINKNLEDAIKDKNYPLATMLTGLAIVQKSIMNPFVGGGSNWIVLGLEKSANPFALLSIATNKFATKKLDLADNKTDITKSLYRDAVYKDSAVRALYGTVVAMAMIGALSIGDDDKDGIAKINNWLNENKWAKKHFNKLSPEAVTFLLDERNGELSKHWQRVLGMKNDYFDNTKQVIKTFSDDKSSTSGAVGAMIGEPLSSPFFWKTIKDINDITRGLKGLPENKTDYNTKDFWNGYFRGGLVDALRLRPNENYTFNSKKQDILDKAKDTNKQIDNIVNKLYDKSMTEEQAIEKLKTLYKDKPEDAKKGIDAVKNRFEDKKIKEEVTDSWYLDFKREQNKDVKAMMFYDKFQKFYENPQKVSKEEREEAEKNLKLLDFKPDNEFMQKVYRYIAENKKVKSPN